MDKVKVVNSTPKMARYEDKLKPLPISGEWWIDFTGRGARDLRVMAPSCPTIIDTRIWSYVAINLYVAEDATSKRQLIVKEIFETEFNYISQLSTINDVSRS